MRVIHCIYSLNPGGVEMFLLNLSAAMQENNVETHVICFYDGPLKESFATDGVSIHILGDIRRVGTHIRFLKKIKEIKADVVNNHMNIMAGVVSIYCRLLKIPFVMYSHSTKKVDFNTSKIYENATNLSLAISKRLMTCGVGVSKDACKAMWGEDYDKKNVRFINLGIDFNRYKPIGNITEERVNFYKQFDFPQGSIVVANVAGYRPQKKYDLFIDVAAEILKTTDKVYFLMIGEGTERERMEEQIAKLGIGNHCRLTGFLNNVPEILKSTVDVFLFTSGFEGLGLALVEAQAAGVYSVYSDVVPEEAVINHDMVKAMSLNDSPKQWAEVIIKAIESGHTAINKHNAYQVAMNSDFNIQKTVQSYINLWKSLSR